MDSLAKLSGIEDPPDVFDDLLLKDFELDRGLDAKDILYDRVFLFICADQLFEDSFFEVFLVLT